MQKIRDSVLKTRVFLDKLSEVYYDVKKQYDKYVSELIQQKKGEDISLLTGLPKNGKNIAVYISANNKMYGDIIIKVFREFADFINKEDCDVMIIGRVGRELYTSYHLKKTYLYLEVPEENVTLEDLKRIAYHLVNYKKINVFYGKFENIINQIPMNSNISGDKPFEENLQANPKFQDLQNRDDMFLFEPSAEKIMQFFETQVFTSLLKQTISESNLARYASRIKAMEEAQINIESRIKRLYIERRKIKRGINNRKQQEKISGISFWNE